MAGTGKGKTARQVEFGDRVRHYRTRLKLSQEALAHQSGLHPTYIAGIESGKRNPSLVSIGRVADGLAVRIADLFPGPEGS